MNIIVPMAGMGDRFVKEGYIDPKPLIKVNGKRIIEYVLDMYDKENDNFIFICNEVHDQNTDIRKILLGLVKHGTVISMAQHKLGPVYTVLTIAPLIIEDEPVIISYCDNPVKWDYDNFKQYVKDNGVDGCVISHRGFHPHTLSSTLFAYSKTLPDNRIEEIKEKSCYTNNRFQEHASSGIYYFRYGHYVTKYFKQLINDNLSYKGEFYVTLVFNLLIKDDLRVFSYLNGKVLAFGTPREVQNFEAWQSVLKGGQVHNEEELILCYNYWKEYIDEENINCP